ncbi:MAG: hypothetical protein HQK53_09685 [Oligoflexia bacterium]|nr:hypothetical protein [Oligoflexia bacterium]
MKGRSKNLDSLDGMDGIGDFGENLENYEEHYEERHKGHKDNKGDKRGRVAFNDGGLKLFPLISSISLISSAFFRISLSFRNFIARINSFVHGVITQIKRLFSFSGVAEGVRSIVQLVGNSTVLPIFLTLFLLCLLVVLFRMKRIELDYRYYEIKQMIANASIKNKELKAQRANLLSVESLGMIAKKYKMDRPKDEQILIVP